MIWKDEKLVMDFVFLGLGGRGRGTFMVPHASVVCFLSTGPIPSGVIIEAYGTIAAVLGSFCRITGECLCL